MMWPDLAEVAARFAALLHQAGLSVTPKLAGRFAEALAMARPQRVDELYWLARVTLVSDRASLEVFDRVFDQIFRGLAHIAGAQRSPEPSMSSTRPSQRKRPPSSGPPVEGDARPGMKGAGSASGADDGSDEEALQASSSAKERLATKAFGVCSPEELAEILLLVGSFPVVAPQRSSRRSRRHRSGREFDLRATLQAARRSGGDPVRRVKRRRRTRPRRVVLIADVSGSMESYGRAYLFLLHRAVLAIGAEAFVFATRLHRLTRPLALQQPAVAMARAMAQTPDWAGGTRIGEALKAFNDDHGRRGLGRGSVVVIVSDGWESGDPQLLAREMQRLARLAYRIVWVNPRKQAADYRPLVGGMAAALPYVQNFVSGHSLAALDEVVAAIRS